MSTHYHYTVVSTGGGTPVTGTDDITTQPTQDIQGIDVSTLHDGTLTYTITLQDDAGNIGAEVTVTAVLDRTAPTGYSVTPSTTATNAATIGLTIDGGELTTPATAFHYTVASSNGGTPVSGSGTITSDHQVVTGINIADLPEGTLTFTVTLTDAAGNVGSEATATATLDRTAPSFTVTPTADETNAGTIGFTIAGGEVTTPGTAFTYTVECSNGGTPVIGNGTITSNNQLVPDINIAGLPEGVLTFTVTLIDPAGNAATDASATALLDRTAPTGYGMTVNDATITDSEAASTSITVTGAALYTHYTCTVTSDNGGEPVIKTGLITEASGTQTIAGINVSLLAHGTLTYKFTLTDDAGNVGTEILGYATFA